MEAVAAAARLVVNMFARFVFAKSHSLASVIADIDQMIIPYNR